MVGLLRCRNTVKEALKEVEAFDTGSGRGWGVKAAVAIKERERVMWWVGKDFEAGDDGNYALQLHGGRKEVAVGICG